MNRLRKGDRVTFEGIVDATFEYGGGEVNVTNSDGHTVRFMSSSLKLVERPGPRLEDLPDGTVIKTVDSVPLLVGDGRLIGSMMGSTVRFGEWDQKPFKVIGACPGTPAWDLWLAAGELDTDNRGEWWRSA